MTIEREEFGWVATCNKCGERSFLGIDDDATFDEAVEFIEQVRWKHSPADKQRFEDFNGSYTETYQHDECADCATDEPAPKPVTRAVPIKARPSVGISNDPCDEWPKHRIYGALGLLPCGHHRGPIHPCPQCIVEHYR